MKKAFLLALGGCVLVVAASAAAYTTPPSPPYHSLILCLQSRTIGSGDAPNNAVITSSDPVVLTIGFGTATRNQGNAFLAAQSGRISITGPSVIGVTWPLGDTSLWAAPVRIFNAGHEGWVTRLYVSLGTLPPGTYTVAVKLELRTPVWDGGATVPKGQWFSTSGCAMTVS